MKKTLLTLSAFALLQAAASAQTPMGFNYQGIARSSTGAPMAAKSLGMRITIHDGTATGAPVYQETQTVTTNAYGLYNLTIGSGTAVVGTLAAVNWTAGNKYIQVEMDATGGTSYADLGTSQLMSVPYAMAAASAPAPALSFSNDTLTAGGNKVKLPAPTLTLTGNTLTAGGNSVTLPSAPTYTGGTGITITGTSIAANAATALWNASQIQGKAVSATAPTSGQELVWNGTAWTPATPATPASYTGGTGITITSGVISANSLAGDVTGATGTNTVTKIQGTSISTTAPTSGQALKYNGTAWTPAADNDAQTLSIAGNTLTVSGGNSITLPSYTAGTGITVSGTNVISANNLSGDVTGAPNAATVAKIQGVSVATTAPINGQVLKYNGTAYAPAADLGVTSTGTTNYVPKTTGTGTEGNSSIYEINSRIGINNTAPQLDFDMVGDSLGIRNGGAPWDNIWMHVDGSYASLNANGADYGMMFRVGAAGSGSSYNSTAAGLDTVMTLMPSGKVGIGTMNPTGILHVEGNSTGFANAALYVKQTNSAGTGVTVSTNTTDAAISLTNSNSGGAIARLFGSYTTPMISMGNGYSSRISSFGAASTSGGYTDGSSAYGLLLGDIQSSSTTIANVGGSSTPNAFVPWLNNTFSLGNSTYKWSAVWSNNGSIQTSDERSKQSITPLSAGLAAVMQLKPVSWSWKNEQERIGTGTNLGFIAQEVEKVLPDVIVHSYATEAEVASAKAVKGLDIDHESYGVKYAEFTPVLVKAIQEQQALIQKQQATIDQLQQRLNALEQRAK